MSVELLEKLIFGLAVLAVLAVGAAVTFLSVVMPGGLRSGIPDAAIDSADATGTWLERERQKKGRGTTILNDYVEPPQPAGRPGAPGQPGQPAGAQGEAASPQAAQEVRKQQITRDFWAGNQDIPRAEQVPNIPWLRRVPGVRYKRPKAVSPLLYQKFQSFQDTWQEVQNGGGEFVETANGTAYQINWVNEQSLLASKIGLKPGDRVISVNGQPIGKSLDAGKGMYEQLKSERRFAVMIERSGQNMVLSYTVGQ